MPNDSPAIPVSEKKAKHSPRATAAQLESLLSSTTTSESEVATAIGVHVNSLRRWRKEDSMPLTASVACEGLIRRCGKSGAVASDVVLVIKGPAPATQTVATVARSLSCSVVAV